MSTNLINSVDSEGDLNAAVFQNCPDVLVQAAGGVGLEQNGVILSGPEANGEIVVVSFLL